MLSTFGEIFTEDLPEELVEFTQNLKIPLGDFTAIFNTGCWYHKNHYTTLQLYTLTPAFISILISVTYHVIWRFYRNNRDVAEAIVAEWFSAVLFLSFCIYPGVSMVVFKTFKCDEFEDYSSALKADYTIDCNAPERQAWVWCVPPPEMFERMYLRHNRATQRQQPLATDARSAMSQVRGCGGDHLSYWHSRNVHQPHLRQS